MGIKDFEPVVSAALPDVVALVPKEPAARLGRWEPKEGHRQRGTRVQTALNEIGDLLSERLLGALELAVDRLAVEDNGYQSADTDTLTALSHNGKAASLYWNVNANFQLTIAEHGKLLYAGDPRDEPGAPHTEDLDFHDFRHRNAKGLTAVARAAGRDITANDLAAIHTADQAYVLEK